MLGDPTSLHYAATALTRLQAVTGVIPRIYGKGTAAAQVDTEPCTRGVQRAFSSFVAITPFLDHRNIQAEVV